VNRVKQAQQTNPASIDPHEAIAPLLLANVEVSRYPVSKHRCLALTILRFDETLSARKKRSRFQSPD
jgi:hypothetical protein